MIPDNFFAKDISWEGNPLFKPDSVTNIKCIFLDHTIHFTTDNLNYLSVYCSRCKLGAYVDTPRYCYYTEYRQVDLKYYAQLIRYVHL